MRGYRSTKSRKRLKRRTRRMKGGSIELVSVVIPTYNRFKYLLNTIQSVKDQTYKNIEIIVVNDKSTDPQYYSYDFGPSVKVIHLKKNSKEIYGYACAGHVRNEGIKISKGVWIAFCDDDDIWLPKKLELQIAALKGNNCKLSSTDGLIGTGQYEKGTSYKRYNAEEYLKELQNIYRQRGSKLLESGFPKIWNSEFMEIHNCVITSSVVIAKEVLDVIGNFREIRPPGEDYDCWKRALKYTDLVYVEEPCFYYDNRHGYGQQWEGGGESKVIAICIYSHSSHFDVLKIQVDYLHKLFKNTDQKLYFFLDKEITIPSDLNYTTIIYSESLSYTKRMLYCIEKIDTLYAIISHESDILIKYNSDSMISLTERMGTMNIDSVDLVIRDLKCKKQEKITDNLFIMNLNGEAWHRERGLLYTVQPRLWKKESAKKFFSSIGDLTYKEVENAPAQKYISENQNTYGVCSANPMMSFGILSTGFPVSAEYVFIHITMHGKFVRKATEQNSVHPEIAGIEKELYEHYIQGSHRAKIGINEKGLKAFL